MKLRVKVLIFTALFLLLFSTVAPANPLTGEIVYFQIIEYLKKYNQQSNPAIDKARQFPSCQSNLKIRSIFGSWKTVEIRCPDNNWKLVVRTNVDKRPQSAEGYYSINTKAHGSVISLKTSLNKGDIIKSSHLTYIKSKKNISGGVFYKETDVVGRTLKQQLSVGSIVRARHLSPNWIITKEQIVMIEHQVGNILINAQGVAQEPGRLGQRIWVTNVNSGKKVLCWIKNDKKVTTNAKIY